jgi:hypothetical protein
MAAATCDQGKGTPSGCLPIDLVINTPSGTAPTGRDRVEHGDADPGDGRATRSATLRAPN